MNTAAITGIVATAPRYRMREVLPTTTFDVSVAFARRTYTFHVRALNDLAKETRYLRPGDQLAINGYLHSELYDMPDRSVWYRVEIVAYDVEVLSHLPIGDYDEVML
ncbi:MAG: single-stranded DNA-binding protein [Acidimicrobiia bacterium]